jgi:hypothetical protein
MACAAILHIRKLLAAIKHVCRQSMPGEWMNIGVERTDEKGRIECTMREPLPIGWYPINCVVKGISMASEMPGVACLPFGRPHPLCTDVQGSFATKLRNWLAMVHSWKCMPFLLFGFNSFAPQVIKTRILNANLVLTRSQPTTRA